MNNFQSTTELTAVEFSPRSTMYQKLLVYTLRLLLLQVTLSLAFFMATRIYLQSNFVVPQRHVKTSGNLTLLERITTDAAAIATTVGEEDLREMAAAQLASLIVIYVLFFPRMRRRAHEHTICMRELLSGIRDLAMGGTPTPMPAGRRGELGYFAVAFNEMACRLLSSRKALVDANQKLEERVNERTQELRDAATKLDKMASTDPLTGLFNRRYFTEQGAYLFKTVQQQDQDLVCVLIDLDDFKLVNDTFGHKMGDELLGLAAVVLRTTCRSEDLIARLGGDEFIVVMQVSDPSLAKPVADRLLGQFTARVSELFDPSQMPRIPSMSIGIASRKTCNAQRLEDIVAAADKALYYAKDDGKNKATIFSTELLAA